MVNNFIDAQNSSAPQPLPSVQCLHTHLSPAGTMSLFDEAEPQEKMTAEQAAGRRVKLYPWDSVASQLFEPYGESALDTLSLQDVWVAASKGNKKAMYHSHLCANQDTDPWHVGAGISLTAAGLLAAIKNFRSPDMKKLIVPAVYEKVDAELKDLEPALVLLNLGKGSQTSRDTGSFRAAKRQKATAAGSEGMTGHDRLREGNFGGREEVLRMAVAGENAFPLSPLPTLGLQHLLFGALRRGCGACLSPP